jgi:Raf kinase inhibitor-like YbhB/YbcL family protein
VVGTVLLVGLAAGGTAMAFTLSSPALVAGEEIPKLHTCQGADQSPALSWHGAPAGTKQFALIVDDPDAPVGTWVHWVVYGVPNSTTELPQAVPPSETLADGARQGLNDFGKVGYGGPCPPPGKPHRYFFKIYALDASIHLKPRASKADLLRAIEGHILGRAELMATFKR